MRRLNSTMILIVSLWFAVVELAGNEMRWSAAPTSILPHGRWEIGLFQPLRYGFSAGSELSTHPAIFLVMPNLTYKKIWRQDNKHIFASRHSVYYPTPLLRLLAKEGIGGVISPEFKIPSMISFFDEILISQSLSERILLTGMAGLGIGITFGDLDDRATIDLPVVLPRLAVFYNGWNIKTGAALTGKISERWSYLLDGLVFLIPAADENFAFEHKALILWNKSARFQLTLGYKLTYTEFPFGTQWHMLPPKLPGVPLWLPLFDLKWTW